MVEFAGVLGVLWGHGGAHFGGDCLFVVVVVVYGENVCCRGRRLFQMVLGGLACSEFENKL